MFPGKWKQNESHMTAWWSCKRTVLSYFYFYCYIGFFCDSTTESKNEWQDMKAERIDISFGALRGWAGKFFLLQFLDPSNIMDIRKRIFLSKVKPNKVIFSIAGQNVVLIRTLVLEKDLTWSSVLPCLLHYSLTEGENVTDAANAVCVKYFEVGLIF